ncbi:MAG TPA: hypothetical protein DCR93_37075 [Cytophagales bacterium]|nr:hypothetical protein [Cytophagales bacterium]
MVFAHDLKFSAPAGPIQVDPEQIPYLELNEQGYNYLNKEWAQGYFQAILVDTSGQKYTGQLFYLSDTSVVLYTTKVMYVPEIFETHHMEMQVAELDRISVRWRQSFRLGMQEGALFATALGSLGTLVLLFNPTTTAIAPLGIFFGMVAAIPTGLQWGLFRYIVPIYKNFNIRADTAQYNRYLPKLKKYTLFPYYWPPSVTEKLLESTPLSSGLLRKPADDTFPLPISEVSLGLSPLMFEVFREKLGNSGISLGLHFDQLGSQMVGVFQESGFGSPGDFISRGVAGFDTEFLVAPKLQAGLSGNLAFNRSLSNGLGENVETLNLDFRRANIQLGVDYLPVVQDRLMNTTMTWGLGAGLAGHSIRHLWTWSFRDINSGQLFSERPVQRMLQPGAFAHIWTELYFSKDTSVRAWAKYHAALPFQFEGLELQAAGNTVREIPAFTNTLLFAEIGISMRWHW